jgi:hypothetical protein
LSFSDLIILKVADVCVSLSKTFFHISS